MSVKLKIYIMHIFICSNHHIESISFQRPLECDIRIFIIDAAILDQNLELNRFPPTYVKTVRNISFKTNIYIYKHMR